MSYVMERSKKHRMQSNPGQARNSNNRKYRWIDWTTRRKPFDNFRHPGNTTEFLQSNYLLNHCENDEWSWYQIVDGREATCPLSITLPSLLEVLVCQHKHLHPLAGAILHPAQSAQEAGTRWNPQSRFSQSVLRRHLCLCIISRSPVSVRMSFGHRYSTRAFM